VQRLLDNSLLMFADRARQHSSLNAKEKNCHKETVRLLRGSVLAKI